MLNILGMSSRILSVTLAALIILQQPAICFQSQVRSTGIRNASRTKPGYLLKDNQTTNKLLFSFDAGSDHPIEENLYLRKKIIDLRHSKLYAMHTSRTNPTSLVLQQLRIEVREGNNITNDIQSAGVVHLSVFVHFGDGNPLEGADITFTAPRNGAGGSFSNNTSSITVMTNNGGIAAVNFNPNSLSGEFSIRVDASFATFSASTRISQRNIGPAPRTRSDPPISQPTTKKAKKLLHPLVRLTVYVGFSLFLVWAYNEIRVEEKEEETPNEPIIIDF